MSSSDRNDADIRKAVAGRARRGPCPDDERLLAFSRGALDAAGEEGIREHLASCTGCVARARDAADFVATVMEDAAPAATPPHAVEAPAAARSSAWWLGLAAAAAVAISAGLWVMRATGPGDITVDAAPYPVPGAPPGGGQGRVYRSGPGSGDPFVVAMERYMAADYATAETGLEAVVAAQPADVQARFYLGVIRLRNGRIADALRDLQIVEQSGAVPEGLDVGWYVTLALVKSGRTAEARDRLDAIVAGRGPRAGEAQRLLDRLDHRTAP